MSVNQMTETTCPTCGAKCKDKIVPPDKVYTVMSRASVWGGEKGQPYIQLIALPQPDLTRLREVCESWKDDSGQLPYDLWQAVKEVLDER